MCASSTLLWLEKLNKPITLLFLLSASHSSSVFIHDILKAQKVYLTSFWQTLTSRRHNARYTIEIQWRYLQLSHFPSLKAQPNICLPHEDLPQHPINLSYHMTSTLFCYTLKFFQSVIPTGVVYSINHNSHFHPCSCKTSLLLLTFYFHRASIWASHPKQPSSYHCNSSCGYLFHAFLQNEYRGPCHRFQCMWRVCARVHVFAFVPLFPPAVPHGVPLPYLPFPLSQG